MNRTINLDLDHEDIKSENNFQNNVSNNLYIPKKFKLIKNSKPKQISYIKKNEKKNNNSYILGQFMNYPRSNNIFSEKLEQNKIFNQTHVIDNDSIKSKIGIKKYSSNDNLQNIYNISCNEYNSNYNIFKDNNTDIFNTLLFSI